MKKGFTLLELIIVVIVIGVLAAVAVPQYFRVVERARTAEAVSILGTLRTAQLRYYVDKSAYATNTALLDVDFTANKFFTVSAPAGTDAEVGKVTRNTTLTPAPAGYGAYILAISKDGTITCTNSTGNSECPKLGY